MRTVINDSEEFQTALIYPERPKLRRGVSPRWRTLAIIGWIFVLILTALAARGHDFSRPYPAPVPGVQPATEQHLAGHSPSFAAWSQRGFLFLATNESKSVHPLSYKVPA